jgi:hypothetical protein
MKEGHEILRATRHCLGEAKKLLPGAIGQEVVNEVVILTIAARHCCHAMSYGMAHFALTCSKTSFACLTAYLIKLSWSL